MKQQIRAFLRPLAIRALRGVDRVRTSPQRYILIQGHMRSGSSLLLHLLMTSREIAGFGERNVTYRSFEDLEVLAIKAALAYRGRRLARYAVDQINHSHYLPDETLLYRRSVFPILLIREPQAAIASMLDVFNQFGQFSLDQGVAHYRERIESLIRYARALRDQDRLLLLTYDRLAADTEAVLARLGRFLELKTTLSATYTTYDFTGRHGDPSSRIRAGRVLEVRRHDACGLPADVLAELRERYAACVALGGDSD